MINPSVEITWGEQQLLFAAAIVVCYGAVAAMDCGENKRICMNLPASRGLLMINLSVEITWGEQQLLFGGVAANARE